MSLKWFILVTGAILSLGLPFGFILKQRSVMVGERFVERATQTEDVAEMMIGNIQDPITAQLLDEVYALGVYRRASFWLGGFGILLVIAWLFIPNPAKPTKTSPATGESP